MKAVYLKYVYYASSIVSIIVITLSIKYVLGGYEPLRVVNCGKIDFSIAGYDISAKQYADHSKIDSITLQLDQQLKSGTMKGEISVLYEVKDQELVPSFVGLIVTSNVTTMPASMDIRSLKREKSLCLSTSMHAWVRPSRIQLLKLFDDYTEANQLPDSQLFLVVRGDEHTRSYFAFSY